MEKQGKPADRVTLQEPPVSHVREIAAVAVVLTQGEVPEDFRPLSEKSVQAR